MTSLQRSSQKDGLPEALSEKHGCPIRFLFGVLATSSFLFLVDLVAMTSNLKSDGLHLVAYRGWRQNDSGPLLQ